MNRPKFLKDKSRELDDAIWCPKCGDRYIYKKGWVIEFKKHYIDTIKCIRCDYILEFKREKK